MTFRAALEHFGELKGVHAADRIEDVHGVKLFGGINQGAIVLAFGHFESPIVAVAFLFQGVAFIEPVCTGFGWCAHVGRVVSALARWHGEQSLPSDRLR